MTDQQFVAYTTPRPDVFAMVPPASRSILDVGCSNGALGESLLRAAPGRRVSGIEYSETYAREAAIRLDRVIHADLNEFAWVDGFGPERFDCMIFADVLEHLSAPEAVLTAARGHLSPGGCIVVSLPNIRHLSALFSIYLGGGFPRRDRGIFDRTHQRWFCIGDAKRMLTETGFTIDRMSANLRWGDQGGGIHNRLLRKLPQSIALAGPVREFLAYQICIRAF